MNFEVDQYAPISSGRDILNRTGVLFLLLVTLICYLCIGALSFSALESSNEQLRWSTGRQIIEDQVRAMLPDASEDELKNNTHSLTQVIRGLADDANPYIYEGRKEAWSFTGGLFCSVSICTTIGYGNIFPVTVGGQVFLVFYALFGIPICFVYIAYLGALLAQSVEYAFDFSLHDRSRKKIMFSVLGLSALLVLLELIAFSFWVDYGLDREMSYWDSFYFSFISFTTIGFGNHGFYNGDNANITKVVFTLLIVIVCLAPLALYINLVVRDVMTAASPILEKIGVSEPSKDPEQEMFAKTKEFQGEQYGAADEHSS